MHLLTFTTERMTPLDGLEKIFLDGGILINPLDTTILLLLLLFNLKIVMDLWE